MFNIVAQGPPQLWKLKVQTRTGVSAGTLIYTLAAKLEGLSSEATGCASISAKLLSVFRNWLRIFDGYVRATPVGMNSDSHIHLGQYHL